MQTYLLISPKINISVVSIRISEDHYGSNLGIEIGALLARERFTSSVSKYSRLLLLVVLGNLALLSTDNLLSPALLLPFVSWRYIWHYILKLRRSCIFQVTLWGIAIKLLK